MIILESRIERYKKRKLNKRQKVKKLLILILTIIIFITGMETVDKAVRDMMNINDKRLCFFDYNNYSYKLHLLGKDYIIEKEDLIDKLGIIRSEIDKVIILIDKYLGKILSKIKTSI